MRFGPALVLASILLAPGDASSTRSTARRRPGPLIVQDVRDPSCFVLRDGPVNAFFRPTGVDLCMAQPDRQARRACGWTLRWSIADGRVTPPHPEDEQPARVHALVGPPDAWRIGLPTYGRIAYDDVLPDTRLVLESQAHALKYTAHVPAGTDRLVLRWDGAQDIRIRDSGLDIRTGLGTVREHGLACWQDIGATRRPVAARYARVEHDGGLAFRCTIVLEEADPAHPVVIDPTIDWSSALGGSDGESGGAIAADAAGDFVTVGTTYSFDFPAPGGFDTSLDGFSDVCVTKVSGNGSAIVWSTYLGGTSDDYGMGVDTGPSGDVYVTGYTFSTDFPTPGGFATTAPGVADAFVARIAAAGTSLVWASYLGGSGSDYGTSIAVDAAGDACVTGYTDSADFPTAGGFDTTLNDGVFTFVGDAFVAKVDAGGATLEWGTYLGGGGDDYGSGVAVDSAGNAYVTGYTSSTDFPTPGGFDTTLNDGSAAGAASTDAFVACVASGGASLAWGSYLGGATSDYGFGIAVDSTGSACVTGYTDSADFPTPGAFDSTLGGFIDAFVSKVAPGGASLAWSSYLGGSADDFGIAVATDPSDNVCVTGYTSSADFPTLDAFDSTLNDGVVTYAYDAFVTEVSGSGALAWSSYLGGSADETASGIAVDPSGNVAASGTTSSTDFPTVGGFDPVVDGWSDAYVVKLQDAPPPPPLPVDPTSLAQSGTAGGPAQPVGFVNAGQQIFLRANVSGGTSPRVEVEIKPEGTAFDGTGLLSGNPVASSGGTSEVAAGPLAFGDYHWRARTIDAASNTSGWVEFDAAAGADFTLAPPPPPYVSRRRNDDRLHDLCGGGAGASNGAPWMAVACVLGLIAAWRRH